MAIRTSAAPSSSGSRTTTPRPRRVSSWTAKSSSRATVSAASSENCTTNLFNTRTRQAHERLKRHLRKEFRVQSSQSLFEPYTKRQTGWDSPIRHSQRAAVRAAGLWAQALLRFGLGVKCFILVIYHARVASSVPAATTRMEYDSLTLIKLGGAAARVFRHALVGFAPDIN